MHWTSIGESTTRALAPQEGAWREIAKTVVAEQRTPGRTLASTHLRPLGVIARPTRVDDAPTHSTQNWARFLTELRRRLDG